MKFYGREKELELLKKIRDSSKKESKFTMITGRRRIGKTSLILKSVEGTKFVYFFISRINQEMLCKEMQSILEIEGIESVGKINRFGDILKTLMFHSKKENLTVVLDEFQDLEYVDKSIFQDIQNVWDRYKNDSNINLIVCGSVHSMMVRIFENEKEPLFGRLTSKIVLNPLPISIIENVLRDYNNNYNSEDLLTFFMLTGGIPKYMEVLMDCGATTSSKMIETVASTGSIFLSDGKDIIITEFGKEYRTYFSILGLIASGKEKRSEIEDILGIEIGAYLKKLEEEYGIVRHVSPILSAPEKRNTKWVISDMYLKFYFRYVRPLTSYVESGRYDLLQRQINSEIEGYEGKILEEFFKRRMTEEETYTKIGSYWNRKGDIEIDIVLVDDITKKVKFIEVKRNPNKLNMKELSRKCNSILLELNEYEKTYEGFSLRDVKKQ